MEARMVLQKTEIAGLSLREAAQPVPVSSPDTLASAAALMGKCAVKDGGSSVLVSPISESTASHVVQALSRALEAIGSGPVLTLQFNFGRTDNTTVESGPAPYRVLAIGNELDAPGLLSGTEGSAVARVDASPQMLSMIASESYGEFVKRLKSKFRFILLDAGSFDKSGEALVLAQKSDGVVFTVREGKTPISELSNANRIAVTARLPVLGFFFEKATNRI